MHISTSLNVFETGYPIDQAVRRCKDAGFSSVDFNYWDYQGRVHGMTWEQEEAWARGIRAAADEHEVRFTQMHGPVHGQAFDRMVMGLDVDSFLTMAERSIRAAALLGVPWVVFHPSLISIGGRESYGEVVRFNRDFFRRLLSVMEKTGVGIALENIFDRTAADAGISRRTYCAIPEELAELIATLDHPLFGACWDTGHAHKQGLGQAVSLRMLGSSLKATHIQDNNGIQDQHLLPFLGTIDWSEVMASLAEIRYAGDFTYETHNSIRVLPDELRDSALAYAAETANYLIRNSA